VDEPFVGGEHAHAAVRDALRAGVLDLEQHRVLGVEAFEPIKGRQRHDNCKLRCSNRKLEHCSLQKREFGRKKKETKQKRLPYPYSRPHLRSPSSGETMAGSGNTARTFATAS